MIDLQEKKRIGLASLRRRLGKVQIPVALGMTLVWMLLFEGFRLRPESLGLLVLGFLVSVLIMLLFPLPPIYPGFRFRPVYLVRMVLYVLARMAVASFQVTKWTFRPTRVSNAVVGVPLRTDSDLMLVCVSIASSIIPGSVVVEVARPGPVLYVHLLGTGDERAVEEGRRDVWRLEERIVRALGTREDIAALRAEEAVGRGGKESV
ncbi:Na+/H+ antiporter subunit E [Nocardiopsis halotolerans]|uniref:Na+/H+ antiporter subunit E n=1 Tax=Nocardiopsis halotolerans TaxID=124252 RepID=UPI000344B7B7|nr:Na+/H+ antiporter subunit E [Nocardiopsis halotolerans]